MNCFEVTQWSSVIEPAPLQIADNYATDHSRLVCLLELVLDEVKITFRDNQH